VVSVSQKRLRSLKIRFYCTVKLNRIIEPVVRLLEFHLKTNSKLHLATATRPSGDSKWLQPFQMLPWIWYAIKRYRSLSRNWRTINSCSHGSTNAVTHRRPRSFGRLTKRPRTLGEHKNPVVHGTNIYNGNCSATEVVYIYPVTLKSFAIPARSCKEYRGVPAERN